MKAKDCGYKEYDRRLTKKFINSLDDKVIIEEIIRELTALKDTSELSSINKGPKSGGSESAKRGAGQYEMQMNLTVRRDNQKHDNIRQSKKKMIENCKYYNKGHPQRQCSVYDKTCSSCCKNSHFKAVCKTT